MIDLGTAAPRIGIFRALVLGDMLCATPALRALRRAWPQAHITLIGLPWAAELAQRLDSLDAHIAFPGHPALPERTPDTAAWPAFIDRVQQARFDLVMQMHGSGRITNPLVAGFGANRLAGYRESGAWCPDPTLYREWPDHGHEIERMLALTDHLGVPRDGRHIDFPLHAEERGSVATLWPRPYVCLHPGAQLPSRRWAPERFAVVGDALARQGYEVLVTGTMTELPIVQAVVGAMRARAVALAGKTTLWELGALIERASLLVCNDTGVSHIAAAVQTPSVVVSLGADVARWAPLDQRRHRVICKDMSCRPCAHVDCPVGHGCATGVGAAEVAQAALSALGLRAAA